MNFHRFRIIFFVCMLTAMLCPLSAMAASGRDGGSGSGKRPTYNGNGTYYDSTVSAAEINNKNFNVTCDGTAITVHMNDKARTSQIWYATVGMTLSRCKFDPAMAELHSGRSSQWVMTLLPVLGNTPTPGVEKIEHPTGASGWTKTDYVIKWETVITEMQAYGYYEWMEELNKALDGEAEMYLRFDSIMVTFNHGIPDPGYYCNFPDIDGTNPSAIKRRYSWSNPSGLNTHYDQYLRIGGTDDTIDMPELDEVVTIDIAEPADYAGGNVNIEGYDASSGIPTTRNIMVTAEAIPWIGQAKVWARMCETTVHPIYVYTWTIEYPGHWSYIPSGDWMWSDWLSNRGGRNYYEPRHGLDTWHVSPSARKNEKDDPNNPGQKILDYYDKVTGHFSVIRRFDDFDGHDYYRGVKLFAAFQYLDRQSSETNIYDFDSLTMQNDIYESDGLLSFGTVAPTEVTIKEAGTSDELHGKILTSKYLKFPTSESLSKTKGQLNKNYFDAFKEVQEDAYNQTKTVNDLLRIKNDSDVYGDAGRAYLGSPETPVKGCNFRIDMLGGDSIGNNVKANKGETGRQGLSVHWEKCTESAAGRNKKNISNSYEKNQQKLHEGNATWEKLPIQGARIPETAYNGKHPTQIKDVLYKHQSSQIPSTEQERVFASNGEDVLGRPGYNGPLYSDSYESGKHRGGYTTLHPEIEDGGGFTTGAEYHND